MNVPLIPSAVPGHQNPGPTGRGAEAADATGFSDTLAQRRDQLQGMGRQARAADTAARPGAEPSDDEAPTRPLTPDETLALLAAGAILPLMDAAQAGRHGDDLKTPHGARDNSRMPGDQAAPGGTRLPDSAALRADGDAPGRRLRTEPQPSFGEATSQARHTPADGARHANDPNTAWSDAGAQAGTRREGPLTPSVAGAQTPATASGVHTAADPGADPSDPARQALAAAISTMTGPASAAAASGAGTDIAMAQVAASLAHAAPGGAPGVVAGPGPATAFVAAPLGDAAWPGDFSRQVLTLIPDGRHGTHMAELRINPPELGPVRIVLQINESVAQALFVSAHAPVRQALENALPQLQQQLAQAGLSLGQADVSDQQPGQQAFAQADPQGHRDTKPMTFSLDGDHLPTSGLDSTDVARPRASRAPDALVDTFA